ncbi:hypothetical protein DL96DRAFT_1564687 [Flagelloscypha sp. PMI_526]|nr:hypothetical protein DL96DRAFT_1564687 [Flagelloscypha sp. PMI_526]
MTSAGILAPLITNPFTGEDSSRSAQDFLRSYKGCMAGQTEAMKCENIRYVLADTAADWFDDDYAGDRGSWTEIEAAFNARWPKSLMDLKMGMEDIGTKVDGEWHHVWWMNQVWKIVSKAGLQASSENVLQVLVQLPDVVKDKMKEDYTDWSEFRQEILKLSGMRLKTKGDEWRKDKAEKEEQTRKLDEIIRLRSPSLRNPTPESPRSRTLRTAFANVDLGGQTRTQQQFITTADAPKVRQHLNEFPVPATAEEYSNQIARFNAKYGEAKIGPDVPYPLTVGTAPADAGACIKCGRFGHYSYSHPEGAPTVPDKEQHWRRTVHFALSPPRPRTGVNMVPKDRTAILGDSLSCPDISNDSLYCPDSKYDIIDLYSVSDEASKHQSIPFKCYTDLKTTVNDVTILASVDDGAMVGGLDENLYKRERKTLGMLRKSRRRLKTADGTTIIPRGVWQGVMEWGGVRKEVELEVFKSGGGWSILLGKPILEKFSAIRSQYPEKADIQSLRTAREPEE